VLRDYRASVGEAEFRRIFARLGEAPCLAEIVLGPHHLLLWDLGASEQPLGAQYYIEAEGRFLMDDVPSDRRRELSRILAAWRKERAAAKPSGRTD